MAAVRSVKVARRQEESAGAQSRDKARYPVEDRVLIASIDSFPASDPPGWIEVKAHPRDELPRSGRRITK